MRPDTNSTTLPVSSSGAAVFVNQAAEYVDPLHRRLDGARLGKRQPGSLSTGSRTWRLQIQAAVWPYGVLVA
jgi:hypothetical protein